MTSKQNTFQENIPVPSTGGHTTLYPRTVEDEVAEMHGTDDIVGVTVHGVKKAIVTNTDPRPQHTYNRTIEDEVAELGTSLTTDEQWAKFGPEDK